VYRFLLTPRWLGLAALTVVLAVVMVGLGNWQLHRYRQKTAINDRIDAAAAAAPVPVESVLLPGRAPTTGARYTRVTATGRYDPSNEILVRGRTVDGRVGFEVLTPLVLRSGAAVLVDRGWVPPARGAGASASTPPEVPPPPAGEVAVTGAVWLPERATGRVDRRGGHLEARRIAPAQLAAVLPYPVLGGYVTTEQDGLRPIEVGYEGTLQNGGYALQWWAFAALTLVGYWVLARRHARTPPGSAQAEEEAAQAVQDDGRTGAQPRPTGAAAHQLDSAGLRVAQRLATDRLRKLHHAVGRTVELLRHHP
jgi:cytochrome oxidase assembly protein ShyY1